MCLLFNFVKGLDKNLQTLNLENSLPSVKKANRLNVHLLDCTSYYNSGSRSDLSKNFIQI